MLCPLRGHHNAKGNEGTDSWAIFASDRGFPPLLYISCLFFLLLDDFIILLVQTTLAWAAPIGLRDGSALG